MANPDMVAMQGVECGRLPAHNPFVGYLHHSPNAGNRNAAFVDGEVMYEQEVLERKKIRRNPYTGMFQ